MRAAFGVPCAARLLGRAATARAEARKSRRFMPSSREAIASATVTGAFRRYQKARRLFVHEKSLRTSHQVSRTASVNRVPTVPRSLPVYRNKQTFSEPVGMSQKVP